MVFEHVNCYITVRSWSHRDYLITIECSSNLHYILLIFDIYFVLYVYELCILLIPNNSQPSWQFFMVSLHCVSFSDNVLTYSSCFVSLKCTFTNLWCNLISAKYQNTFAVQIEGVCLNNLGESVRTRRGVVTRSLLWYCRQRSVVQVQVHGLTAGPGQTLHSYLEVLQDT